LNLKRRPGGDDYGIGMSLGRDSTHQGKDGNTLRARMPLRLLK